MKLAFDIDKFCEDIKSTMEIDRETYKSVAEQTGLTSHKIRNLLNLDKCTVDTFLILCHWAQLEPDSYFIKYSR